ncbi:MAG: NifU family protein [Candidatus Thorarchaeota archaeon]
MSTVSFEEKVKSILYEEISPALQRDGGGVELVDIDETEKTVTVRFLGACRGCPMSQITFAGAVQRTLKQRIPEINRVIPAP